MRLFYRINKPVEESRPVESIIQSNETTNKVLNLIDNSNKSSESPTKINKKIESNEKEIKPDTISTNVIIDKQSKSFKEDEENNKNKTAEISVNNSTTTKEENHQPMNENLTITAMVASISVKKDKTPIKFENSNQNLESNELISNSDKENEEDKSKLENTIIKQTPAQLPASQLPIPIQPAVDQHQNHYESNLNNHQIHLDYITKQQNDKQPKQIKPKTQKSIKKKEALIATNNNINNNSSSDQLNNSIMSNNNKRDRWS